jgi:Mannosylglycerate hydrolase MGH1-like glycoside hydrolase domain/Glycosyl hydrolase family 63 C-terminal domain
MSANPDQQHPASPAPEAADATAAEAQRLRESEERAQHWKRWGPYVSERAWGTVREDYSPGGTAWESLPHDHARSRAYRWNEDGIAGISDRHQMICFALVLWNGRDPILKERLFGLTGNEGNHAEDVKEQYFYLDNTPTHSYMRFLYKYPQAAFPYSQLVRENRHRGRGAPEFELIDTGVFGEGRYFDVFVDYAKASPEDILIHIHAANRGPEPAVIHLLPTVWFRNTWLWGDRDPKPRLHWIEHLPPHVESAGPVQTIELQHFRYGTRWLACEGSPEILFTDNETNFSRLWGVENDSVYSKDGINDYMVNGILDAVNPNRFGTKASPVYRLEVEPGQTASVRLRFFDSNTSGEIFGHSFEQVFARRRREADEFYDSVLPETACADSRAVMRQALAGMLWSKQFYNYVVQDWLRGDQGFPEPPRSRHYGRNSEWGHIFNADVISMPDKWEYPWYAAWDLGFHAVALALVDSDFAKEQLALMVREWYMHPSGQLPAYEWAFSDVNPPVHAWAVWRVYKIEKKRRGVGDRTFLQRVFHKLLLNFTWWVNRKDTEGRNVFQGGFLGLDNVGIFDRSAPLPTGGFIQQADGTGWMAMYSLNLLAIALELALEDPAYEDVASKFWEHFLYIANAINSLGDEKLGMWHPKDGFYYDVLCTPDGGQVPLRVRSMVGLIPLFAVQTLETDWVKRFQGFKRRMDWFIEHRPDLTKNVASMTAEGSGERRLLSILNATQLRRVLKVMLDEEEFLSPYGIRSLSRAHGAHPYALHIDGNEYRVGYEPAESRSGVFGGNSNWRGPIWFPVNYLIIESLQKFHHYFGDEFKVECPTGSGHMMNLWEVAKELSRRLAGIFLPGPDGARPVHGSNSEFATDPHWRDLVLFYEYFHGDNGTGLGASHQTGWTGLVAKLMQQIGE